MLDGHFAGFFKDVISAARPPTAGTRTSQSNGCEKKVALGLVHLISLLISVLLIYLGNLLVKWLTSCQSGCLRMRGSAKEIISDSVSG